MNATVILIAELLKNCDKYNAKSSYDIAELLQGTVYKYDKKKASDTDDDCTNKTPYDPVNSMHKTIENNLKAYLKMYERVKKDEDKITKTGIEMLEQKLGGRIAISDDKVKRYYFEPLELTVVDSRREIVPVDKKSVDLEAINRKPTKKTSERIKKDKRDRETKLISVIKDDTSEKKQMKVLKAIADKQILTFYERSFKLEKNDKKIVWRKKNIVLPFEMVLKNGKYYVLAVDCTSLSDSNKNVNDACDILHICIDDNVCVSDLLCDDNDYFEVKMCDLKGETSYRNRVKWYYCSLINKLNKCKLLSAERKDSILYLIEQAKKDNGDQFDELEAEYLDIFDGDSNFVIGLKKNEYMKWYPSLDCNNNESEEYKLGAVKFICSKKGYFILRESELVSDEKYYNYYTDISDMRTHKVIGKKLTADELEFCKYKFEKQGVGIIQLAKSVKKASLIDFCSKYSSEIIMYEDVDGVEKIIDDDFRKWKALCDKFRSDKDGMVI